MMHHTATSREYTTITYHTTCDLEFTEGASIQGSDEAYEAHVQKQINSFCAEEC